MKIRKNMHIFCHSLTRRCHSPLKFFLEDRDLFLPHSQCCGCWCPGDRRGQGISNSHGIELVFLGGYSLSTRWVKGCVSLNPSKISKSGWWGLQLDAWQLCNSLWYGLINSKLHINKKIFFLYHTTSDGVTVQCFKSPSWPLRNGLDLWPQLIYTLSWESQHKEI